jgi:hypothetical protein
MRPTRAAAAVLAGLMLAILPLPGPAGAHDKGLKLEVAGDGATGVTVQARHADGHRLDTPVLLALTATAEGGRTVGPLQLEPAGEGAGFYTSGPILAPGTWRVTVRAPAPHTGKATVEVRARAAQSAPAPAAAAKRGSTPEAEPWWRWWTIGIGVLAVLTIVAMVLHRRRRARNGRGSSPTA